MININLVCVGNLKERFWSQAIEEYSKRISAFAKLSIIEVAESNYKNCTEGELSKAKSEEAIRLQKYAKGYCVALEINGKQMSSELFAHHISTLALNGNSTISFFIGGSYGLDKSFSDSLNEKLSFSSFTFPHQLMRVILVEQIYRALTIINNRSYHK